MIQQSPAVFKRVQFQTNIFGTFLIDVKTTFELENTVGSKLDSLNKN